MSFDLGIWYAREKPTPDQAGQTYMALCDEEVDGLEASPKMEAFYAEMMALYPAMEDLDDDACDASPWSVTPSAARFGVIICLKWSTAEQAANTIIDLALKHGLICYDLQAGTVFFPDAS